MAFLLDTNHCIYLINGLNKKESLQSEAERKIIETARSIEADIFMSEATLGELYFGAANSARKEENFRRIELFKEAVIPIQIDETTWKLFGITKAILRKQGKSLSDTDLLIACTAKIHKLILVTNDADFDVLPSEFLKENWV